MSSHFPTPLAHSLLGLLGLLGLVGVAACGGGGETAEYDPAPTHAPDPASATEPPSPAASDAPAPCVDELCEIAPPNRGGEYGYAIVTRGERLFWSAWGAPQQVPDGHVFSAPKDGSEEPTVLARELQFPSGIAVDDAHLYVAETSASRVLRCTDEACDTDAPFFVGPRPQAVALDDDAVYVAVLGDVGEDNGSIVRCPKTGCGDGGLVIASGRRSPDSIAVAGGTLTWTERQAFTISGSERNAVYACPTLGCGASGPVVVADQQVGARRLRAHGDDVYWVTQGSMGEAGISGRTGGGVWRASAAGGGATELVDLGDGFPDDVAVTPAGLFAVDPARATWIPTGGSAVEIAIPESMGLRGRAVAADGDEIFVLTTIGAVARRTMR